MTTSLAPRGERLLRRRWDGAIRRARTVLGVTRASDWWLYHLLPLVAAAYAAIAYFAAPATLALPALARLVVSIICIAAYAHLVNDMADEAEDRAAGKRGEARAVPHHHRLALAILLLIGGFAAWTGAGLSRWSIALLAVIAGLQPVYALRPIRLKERGGWGIAVDALHTHALPTLFCIALFADLVDAPVWQPFPVVATAWAFLVGVRGILYHQRIDEANDRRAGLQTFVTTHGSHRADALARQWVFPAELVALGVLGVTLIAAAPLVIVSLTAYACVSLWSQRVGIRPSAFADPAPATKGGYVPILTFYRRWPALAFALFLATTDRRFLLLLLLHTVVCIRELAWEATDLAEILLRRLPRSADRALRQRIRGVRTRWRTPRTR